jgi:hypothetical protein
VVFLNVLPIMGKARQQAGRALKVITLSAVALILVGCATSRGERPHDAIEAVLAAPQDQVRAALIQVLTEDGYSIQDGRNEGRILSTAYREETRSIWDWLLLSRFGVNRSRVDATFTPEDQVHTRLSIQISYEAKRHIWSLWQDSSPALQQSAANQLRLVKNVLGLL